MIWYLLYPFRGTTEPPRLGPAHPLRRTFNQYGREAARHPVITLLISVAIATILIYPFPFLYTNNFANGSSNLPHHVWTAAQPFDGNSNIVPDVVMRSFWVHGSHMRALEYDVLQAALDIQDGLLGPTIDFNPRSEVRDVQLDEIGRRLTRQERDSLHAVNGLGNSSWFFHSPLLYWNCSARAIEADDDIMASVNERSRQPTSVNVTLRHSIVFSGKRFEDQKLIAADALVITLIHKLDSPVGRQWEREAELITRRFPGRWRLYPPDGRTLPSQLYEFRFKPLSLQDDVVLSVAYSFTIMYFLLSLTRLRALKSRFGLSVSVITQFAFSIMSSFTICAVFKIDLSKIPREAYPLVVLTVGLENVFRFINAIIVTPSQSSTAARIGDALGQTGHIALAGVAQNLYILWLLGKVVSPGVAAFCIFAAIALIFDFLYLLTFFVAVLSVEVRRTELGESLSRRGQRSRSRSRVREQKSGRQDWTDAILRSHVPISTRISGTIVLIGFVLIAQWHFFDHESPMQTFSRVLQLTWMDPKPTSPPRTQLSVDVNQARSPTAWLRLQDHETAREVIQVIKPHGHSYIARVYEPLVFVLSGSDRRPSHRGVRSFLPAFYDFANHQSGRLIVTIFFVVAAVSLLMNYLLWGEEDAPSDEEGKHGEDEPLMAVRLFNRAHALDIGMLAASPDGIVVSVGLDRRVMVWDIRQDNSVHQVDTLTGKFNAFPILAIAVDEHASWLALLCTRGIMLWDIQSQKWGQSVELSLQGQSPLAFFFIASRSEPIAPIAIIRSNGMMTQVVTTVDGLADLSGMEILKGSLVSACRSYEASPAMQPQIITSSCNGYAYITTQVEGKWVSAQAGPFSVDSENQDLYVYPMPRLRAFLAIRHGAVDLVDVETLTSVHTFKGTISSSPANLRALYSSSQPRQSAFRGLTSFSLVYTEYPTGSCVVRTYSPRREGEVLCIDYKKCPRDQHYSTWESAIVTTRTMEDPGKWETLPIGVIIGVRKVESPVVVSRNFSYSGFSVPTSSLRRRAAPTNPLDNAEDDAWEAWMLSTRGEQHTIALTADENGSLFGSHLLVGKCGPMTKVGQRSIAVALGNVVKVITVGHETFTVDESPQDMALAMEGRRRRLGTHRRRSTTKD